MMKQSLPINDIPAILWGNRSDKLFVAVHGNMSHKEDDVIAVFAEEATAKGYQVLSFDLPEHGDRKGEPYSCTVPHCVKDLEAIMAYAASLSGEISVFACSMGAYFSLLAYNTAPLKKGLFLSPVVDMRRLITNMMAWSGVSEAQLEAEREIATAFGQTLYWAYYCDVKSHPIDCWQPPTAILCGAADNVCEWEVVSAFSRRFHCALTVMEAGEHYFHTAQQLAFLRGWLKEQF